MTILEEARGQAPVAPVDPKGVAYGIDRTGNVPHVKTVDGSIVETGDDSVVTTLTGSVTKTESGSLTKTETGSLTKTETGSLTKTETGSLTKTESGSKTTTETGSVTKTETGSLTKTESGSKTTTETGSVTKTETGSKTTTETGSVTKTETGSLTKTETGSLTKTETGSLTKTETGSLTKTEQGSVVSITDNSSNKVTTTTDGGKIRLDVSVQNPVITAPDPLVPSNSIATMVAAGRLYAVTQYVNAASTGANNPLILLRNPAGSGKTCYIYEIYYGITVTNTLINFLMFHTPTITANGTAITPVNNCIGGGFGASVILASSLPTITNSGTNIRAAELKETQVSLKDFVNFSIQLRSNNNLLITGKPSLANKVASITVVWAEY